MPPRPKKPCRHPGCTVLTQDRSGYCPEHKELAEQRKQARQAARDRQRESAAKRGYGHKWREARKGFLRSNPLCASCLHTDRAVPATVVDHITPHKGDKALFWDRKNWQPLCKRCHDLKTARGE
ncbi:HNH endonuclease [Oleidesulfovibrio sp.]|uniref:HNH endonuclease n=1 Tax=Oleidesulfovibrio sp. TaxID=2909707 RepID=UPI003A881825